MSSSAALAEDQKLSVVIISDKQENFFKRNARRSVKVVSTVFDDFKAFIKKGNVVDLAVGLVMGAAFTGVVTSAVTDLITPIIAYAIQTTSLSDTFVIMACPKSNGTGIRPEVSTCAGNFSTVAVANQAGAITWNYGNFIQQCLNFLATASIVFFIIKIYTQGMGQFKKRKVIVERECLYCLKMVPCKASKCSYCTSTLEIQDLPVDGVNE